MHDDGDGQRKRQSDGHRVLGLREYLCQLFQATHDGQGYRPRLNARLAELPGAADDAFAGMADLTDRAQVESLIADLTSSLGTIEILVNNAGMVQTGVEDDSMLLHEISDR